MGGSSRYDRDRPVGQLEDAEARALHAIARLLGDYDGIRSHGVRVAVGALFDACAIELGNGRVVVPPVRLAVRRLANEIRGELDPRTPGNDERSPAHPEG